MESKKLLILAGSGLSTNVVYHALSSRYYVATVILEEKENRQLFLKRRIRRMGLITVAGQIIFQFTVAPILSYLSKKKIQALIDESGFSADPIHENKIVRVGSVNAPSVQDMISKISPDVIVVNGTRILSKKLLAKINCPVINMHAGITPMYRGVHGTYWALMNDDKANCGVTVHLIDPGIDTGEILYQSQIEIAASDNFATYPVKQMLAGIPLLIKAVGDAIHGQLKPSPSAGHSALYYHPTIWKYLYGRFIKKVR